MFKEEGLLLSLALKLMLSDSLNVCYRWRRYNKCIFFYRNLNKLVVKRLEEVLFLFFFGEVNVYVIGISAVPLLDLIINQSVDLGIWKYARHNGSAFSFIGF